MKDTFPRSGHEDKFVAERGGNRPPRIQQRLKVCLGRLLKAQDRFSSVSAVRMATGEEARFGDPHPVLVLAQLNFGNRYNHGWTIKRARPVVNTVSRARRTQLPSKKTIRVVPFFRLFEVEAQPPARFG